MGGVAGIWLGVPRITRRIELKPTMCATCSHDLPCVYGHSQDTADQRFRKKREAEEAAKAAKALTVVVANGHVSNGVTKR